MDVCSGTAWFAVKRLDLNGTGTPDVVSLSFNKNENASEVTQRIRSKLELNDADLIFKVRNTQGHLIPLNGKVTDKSSSSSPFTLEVVRRFQSVEPEPNSLTLAQFEEALMKRLKDIQDRIGQLELAQENMTERRAERLYQEIEALQNTVDFLTRRLDEAESVHWNGMFIRYPLW
ncbi:hypothetical protein BsWGS_12459 [Bradybaena similaris]